MRVWQAFTPGVHTLAVHRRMCVLRNSLERAIHRVDVLFLLGEQRLEVVHVSSQLRDVRLRRDAPMRRRVPARVRHDRPRGLLRPCHESWGSSKSIRRLGAYNYRL